jgi:hypothetical protein
MKKILIVPDISGWAIESMADGIIDSLSDKFEFTKKFSDKLAKEQNKKIINWKKRKKYDVIFLMIPGYLPKLEDYSKIVTSFNGGPGSESQANILQRKGLQNMRISYLSEEMKSRLDKPYKSIQKMDASLGKVAILKELGLRQKDTYRISRIVGRKRAVRVRVEFTKYGFDLTNLCFTPQGVDTDYFNQEKINNNFVCGYAGWIQYLMDDAKKAQKDHRRGHWIINAQRILDFNLSIAGGLKNLGGSVSKIKGFNSGRNVKAALYEKEDMKEYYSELSCYLVPDKFAGGPLPVLEAGAMGIPVVCTDAGLCGDFIENGFHGLVVKTYDEFVRAIKWMRNHPKEREEMGKNLQSYIRKNRTWEAVAPYWEKFFDEV